MKVDKAVTLTNLKSLEAISELTKWCKAVFWGCNVKRKLQEKLPRKFELGVE